MRNKVISIIVLSLILSGCGVYNSLMNISKLKFKLGSIDNFKVGSISINNKSKLSDFGAVEIMKLTSNVVSGKFPVTFRVNIVAKNPNKSEEKSNLSSVSLVEFPWTLYIDNTRTISGNISQPVEVPAEVDKTIIPLDMKLDLMDYFKNVGLNNLINLALTLGGTKGSSSKIKVVAEPVISTPLGRMKYPQPLTIIDKQFN